jgi:hypothetical protein
MLIQQSAKSSGSLSTVFSLLIVPWQIPDWFSGDFQARAAENSYWRGVALLMSLRAYNTRSATAYVGNESANEVPTMAAK